MRTVASSNFASLEVGYELLRCVKTLPKTQQIWKDQIAHEWPKRLVETLSKDILIYAYKGRFGNTKFNVFINKDLWTDTALFWY